MDKIRVVRAGEGAPDWPVIIKLNASRNGIAHRRRKQAATNKLNALERFRAKWTPVRVKKTRQNKNLEPGSDSIRTGNALNSKTGNNNKAGRSGELTARLSAGPSVPGVARATTAQPACAWREPGAAAPP